MYMYSDTPPYMKQWASICSLELTGLFSMELCIVVTIVSTCLSIQSLGSWLHIPIWVTQADYIAPPWLL